MKMKKWMLFIVVVLQLCGCSQPAENTITPPLTDTQYTAENLFSSTDDKMEVTLPDNTTESQNKADVSQPLEESELLECLKPQENIQYVKYDTANYPKTIDLIKNFRSVFCMDPDTGVVYFVNQNKDEYIYCLVNGEAKLVVELPARELHMQNGVLYFILTNSGEYEYKELAPGDVYAYTLADGSINKIFSPEELEGDIYRIFPYEDGIAFSMRVVKKEIEIDEKGRAYYPTRYDYFYYSFETALVEADTYKRAALGWKDYYLATTENETGWHCELLSRENEEEGKLSLETGNNGFVVEDTFYSYGTGKLWIHNLLDGEKKLFDITELLKKIMPQYMAHVAESGVDESYNVEIDAVIVNKDGIWMIVQFNFLLHLEPETGETKCYRIGEEEGIFDLYTDGINLYGTYGSSPGLGESDDKMVRICTEKIIDQDWFSGAPIIDVEYLTE